MAHTFVEALAGLEPVGAKRTAAFLSKLLRDSRTAGLHSEPIHDAHDRSIRSLRVSDDLRAIARLVGGRLLLLFVGHHDAAYLWARDHCTDCELPDAGRRITIAEIPVATTAPLAASASSEGTHPPSTPAWFCTLEDGHQLCQALDSAGIEHSLAP
jgi:hypothetical protein